jgi:glycosyltransferase involved in cell wall biosynthesis
MSTAVLIVPGSIATRTGGYEYDRRMLAGLRALGWAVDVRELDASFPRPSPAAIDHAGRVLAAIPDGATVVVDGLAFGAMPGVARREARRLRLVALVHLPLAAEIGIGRDAAAQLEAGEREALASASLVVVTGKATADAVAAYGVRRDRIALVEPGTERAPLARGSHDASALHLVSVAALVPGKGHEILFRALAAVPHQRWRLTCAGSLHRHPPTAERLRAMILDAGWAHRVSLAGDLDADALSRLYDSADVCVLATLHETYGMAVAEALARGIPVVGTATGAIPELLGLGGAPAGLVAPPGDEAALAAELTRMLGDAHIRDGLAAGARLARERLPTWEQAAVKMAAALVF